MHHYLHSAGLSATSDFFPLLSHAKLHYQKWFRGTVSGFKFLPSYHLVILRTTNFYTKKQSKVKKKKTPQTKQTYLCPSLNPYLGIRR